MVLNKTGDRAHANKLSLNKFRRGIKINGYGQHDVSFGPRESIFFLLLCVYHASVERLFMLDALQISAEHPPWGSNSQPQG